MALAACLGSCGTGQNVLDRLGSSAQGLEGDEITIGPAGKSMNYFHCADEGGTCVIAGSRYMAFGSNGTFVFALKSGQVACNTATFGANSAPNKACYFSNYGNFPNTAPIATENQATVAYGSVAYGANGAFFFKTFHGLFSCNNATFGDPIVGVGKACYLGVPVYSLAAPEGGTLYSLYNTPVAYGANGKFNFRMVAGSADLTCNAATFGDPGSGATNDCYRLMDGHLGIVPAAYSADEGGTWKSMVQGSTAQFYGSGRNGNFFYGSVGANSGSCSNAFGDPDFGWGKHCWVAPFTSVGSWQQIGATFPCLNPSDPNSCFGPDHLQLLMDGSVLASQRFRGEAWYRYRPDPVTGYAGGTWSGPYLSHYTRSYYATGMLPDGRYVVAGGEKGVAAMPSGTPAGANKCEVFDPVSNSWHDLPDYPNGDVGGGVAASLPDGRLVVGGGPGGSMVFDPAVCPRGQDCTSNPWSNLEFMNGSNAFAFGEGSITHLQTGNLLAAENRAGTFVWSRGAGMRWQTVSSWPSSPPATWDDSVLPGMVHGEAAALLTLYSGKVLITAATGYNAIYDPVNDTIVSTALTPQYLRADENVQAVMPNGNALFAVTRNFNAYKFYVYDTGASVFWEASLGAPDFSSRNGNLLQTPLPDGNVLVSDAGFKEAYLYHPAGSLPAQYARPSITSITAPPSGSNLYTLSGTTLCGLTNGANRDDEGHNYTSFPVVMLQSGSSTWYADVRSVSTMSIQSGMSGSVQFVVPSGLPRPLTVRVSASGVLSSNTGSIF